MPTGDILVRTDQGWRRLPAGIAGQVLQSNGPGIVPAWVAPVDVFGGGVGPTGAAGAAGARGTDGIFGMDGLDGEDGFDGLPGARGADGAQGTQGAAGVGLLGPSGLDGEDGEEGWPGQPGVAGVAGASGAAGTAGSMGPPGMDGEDSESFSLSGIPRLNQSIDELAGAVAAQGDVLIRTVSGWKRLPIGATHLVLTSQGAGFDPIWGAVQGDAGGGLVLLEQHSASASASLDFTTWYSAAYDRYVIEIINLIPTTNARFAWLRMSTDGGASYDAGANYSWVDVRVVVGASAIGGGNGQNQILIDGSGGTNSLSNNANWGLCGKYELFSPGSTAVYKRLIGECNQLTSIGPTRQYASMSAAYESTTAVNAFRILLSNSDTIASGIVRMYGIAK